MQLTNSPPFFKPGTDDDLEFYVRKCGEILGVTPKLDKDERDGKHVLEYVFFQLVEFKKLNQVRLFHWSLVGGGKLLVSCKLVPTVTGLKVEQVNSCHVSISSIILKLDLKGFLQLKNRSLTPLITYANFH